MPPGRGHAGVPGRPHRATSSSSTSRPGRPPRSQLRDLSEGVFQPGVRAPARRRCGWRPAYAWVADYYPTEAGRAEDGDGRLRISLRVADPAWVRALVLGSAGQVEVLVARTGWPRTSAPRPRARSRPTPRIRHGEVQCSSWSGSAIGAWIAAVVSRPSCSGFCAYEMCWKATPAARATCRLQAARRERWPQTAGATSRSRSERLAAHRSALSGDDGAAVRERLRRRPPESRGPDAGPGSPARAAPPADHHRADHRRSARSSAGILYDPLLHFLEHPYCSVPLKHRFPGTKTAELRR